jgi:FAD:protein FMN transferase
MIHTFEALGTKWWITVFDEASEETLKGACGALERFAHEYETKYSRFKPDSLISQLNRERVLEQPDEEIQKLLAYGKSLYIRSNTKFNLLTGHILEARGYNAEYSFNASEPELLQPGNPVTNLTITPEKIEVSEGNVDIGGFGKGYLIDELARLLKAEHKIKYFLINGGGDMYGTSKQGEPIEIYLEHPTEAGKLIEKTTLFKQGFAASSPFKRVWHSSSRTYSHIVTDAGVSQVATYVKAETARDADAFATTALLLPETDLAKLAQTEELSIARFDPATGQLWRMHSFDQKPDESY